MARNEALRFPYAPWAWDSQTLNVLALPKDRPHYQERTEHMALFSSCKRNPFALPHA